ncbi:MAG: ribose-phosphate diphosphokinase [Pseudomonadota bacterium]
MKLIATTHNNDMMTLELERFTFSGGEEHIQIKGSNLKHITDVRIITQLNSSSAVIQLAMIKDALTRLFGQTVRITAEIRYFPYARQDRVCNKGEALGVKVMADMVNAMAFDRVVIWDAHSDVTPALLNNVVNVSQADIINAYEPLAARLRNNTLTLVSPDSGALKKTQHVADYFDMSNNIVRADKKRNIKTREIKETVIYDDVEGKDLLIVDDICDGGRTFIELAKVLKSNKANTVSLYVTHGIFCNGLAAFGGLIDEIITTESFKDLTELKQTQSQCTLTIINS